MLRSPRPCGLSEGVAAPGVIGRPLADRMDTLPCSCPRAAVIELNKSNFFREVGTSAASMASRIDNASESRHGNVPRTLRPKARATATP